MIELCSQLEIIEQSIAQLFERGAFNNLDQQTVIELRMISVELRQAIQQARLSISEARKPLWRRILRGKNHGASQGENTQASYKR